VALVCLSNEPRAQTTTSAGLTGVITDQSTAVVPGADVEIKDSSKGATQSTKTDSQGVYRFFFLAPARYLLTLTHGGFREEKRVVSVLLGPPVSVNITLKIATKQNFSGTLGFGLRGLEALQKNTGQENQNGKK
jgi:Carboxypeptidase regulatory-like domain